jgi:hypothetical protein
MRENQPVKGCETCLSAAFSATNVAGTINANLMMNAVDSSSMF